MAITGLGHPRDDPFPPGQVADLARMPPGRSTLPAVSRPPERPVRQVAGEHERPDDLGEPVLGLDLAGLHRVALGMRRPAERPREPRRTSRARPRGIRERAAAAIRRERASAASSRSGSGRSPSPHICIARWAGYSSPDFPPQLRVQRLVAGRHPPAPLHERDVPQRGAARHHVSAAASNGARASASHPSDSSKSVGRSSSAHTADSACGSTLRPCADSSSDAGGSAAASQPLPGAPVLRIPGRTAADGILERAQRTGRTLLLGGIDPRELRPCGLIAVGDGQVLRPARLVAEFGERPRRLGTGRVEMRAPAVGGDTQRVGQPQAARVGAAARAPR